MVTSQNKTCITGMPPSGAAAALKQRAIKHNEQIIKTVQTYQTTPYGQYHLTNKYKYTKQYKRVQESNLTIQPRMRSISIYKQPTMYSHSQKVLWEFQEASRFSWNSLGAFRPASWKCTWSQPVGLGYHHENSFQQPEGSQRVPRRVTDGTETIMYNGTFPEASHKLGGYLGLSRDTLHKDAYI